MFERSTRIGDLHCRVVQSDDPGLQLTRAAVLCHGFGAPGDDLVPLGHEVLSRWPELARDTRFVFPEGPLELAAFGLGDARAWWPLDFTRMMAASRGDAEYVRTLREETPEGLPHARRLLLGLLDGLTRQMSIPLSRVTLGGFSQGAMLATDVALRLEEAPAGLAIFSGTLICEAEWMRRARLRRGLRVFMSHGQSDPLLPYENAENLRALLAQAGLVVTFEPFEGGHALPFEAVEGLAALLAG